MLNYHSNMIWLPGAQHGPDHLAMLMPVQLRGPLLRKFLEIVFDSKPETVAEGDRLARHQSQSRQPKAARAADAAPPGNALGKLAAATERSSARITTSRAGWQAYLRCTGATSSPARNEDGTESYILSIEGVRFVTTAKPTNPLIRDTQRNFPACQG